MADVQPLTTLRYDLAAVGSLDKVAAPPYDVIDAPLRARLAARSPFNVVEVDLPEANGGDPYLHAQTTMEAWLQQGIVTREREPAIWAMTQDYTGPDGNSYTRHGFFCRVRVEDYGPGRIRPHERTQPGPKEDRLRLTRATRANLSPIFSLFPDPDGEAWSALEPVTGSEPYATVRDDDGTVNRLWRIEDPAVHAAVTERLAGAQLLIADGHHRYETARAFRDEVGGEGPHNYTLMSLTGLDDPGLTVFPTHRLLSGFADDPERQQRLGNGLRELFEVSEVGREEIDPAGSDGVGVFGFIDSHHKQAFRLRLKDTAELDRLLEGKPEAYRRLDSAILETLVLKGLAGMSDHDIDERNGLEYAKSVPDALAMVEGGGFDVAFILRPVPVEQVKAVAETDANMPPKSTYFFPKVMTGFAFNPVR